MVPSEYSGSCLSSVAPCPLMEPKPISKMERFSERKNIIDKGKKSNDPQVAEAANRLERQNIAVERAKLADHVYKSDKEPAPEAPEGWKQLDEKELKELGLEPKDLVDKKTGLKAAIYKSDFEAPPKTVIAFAGTEDMADVKVNVAQGVGRETKQYNQGMEITSHLANALGPENLEVTGHSLGGGVAAAGSTVTGVKATTFNAAGLSPQTAKRLNIDKETQKERAKNIDAYNSDNDPLTAIQDSVLTPGMNKAVGNRYVISAAPKNALSWKNKIIHPVESALIGHGSLKMVHNIEHQKNQDVNTILNDKETPMANKLA